MSLMQTAHQGYGRLEGPVRTPRRIEYDLLARATQRLAGAWAKRAEDFPALAAALDDNRMVWSAFAADVAGQGNGLPQALRARLFYLYEFTVVHSRAVLDKGVGVEVLVDINTAVMRGLRGDEGAA